jgi:hypothetical protein
MYVSSCPMSGDLNERSNFEDRRGATLIGGAWGRHAICERDVAKHRNEYYFIRIIRIRSGSAYAASGLSAKGLGHLWAERRTRDLRETKSRLTWRNAFPLAGATMVFQARFARRLDSKPQNIA